MYELSPGVFVLLHGFNAVRKVMIIGIDVGGSTTKIVGIDRGCVKYPMFVKANDPVTSLFGAFGKYLYDNSIPLADVEQVMLTGVGSSYIRQPLYGLPTARTDEFIANGLGAQYVTDLHNLIVVSMGTGTSFVQVEGEQIRHIGGIGIGGGTLIGLSRLLLQTSDILWVAELARKGDAENVDLLIQDICKTSLPGLPLHATAALFGKADNNVRPEDVASGLIHMVLQSIGQAAVLASLNSDIRDFVLIGNLTRLPQCEQVFRTIGAMYGVRFLIPECAEYRTAIGAALTHIKQIAIHPV